jgi:hypothetical protein
MSSLFTRKDDLYNALCTGNGEEESENLARGIPSPRNQESERKDRKIPQIIIAAVLINMNYFNSAALISG